MNLVLDQSRHNEEIWIQVSGEIDVYTSAKLREELWPLADRENQRVIVNLKDVTYIDSTGLGVFVGLFKKLAKNHGELKLVGLSDRLERLFNITGLNNIIDISSN